MATSSDGAEGEGLVEEQLLGEDATRAMDALRRVVRALRVSSRAVERTVGISAAQLFVLRQLAESPRQSLGDLVARTRTHQSTVSEVVSRLVDAGLVARRTASDDGRRAELSLTARGRALLRSAPSTVPTELVEGFARLPAARRRALAEGLEAWLAAAGLAEVEPTMFFESRTATSRRTKERTGGGRRTDGGTRGRA